MPTTFHRTLKITAFNTDGIGRQLYEVRKQLQKLKNRCGPVRFYIPNYDIYRTDHEHGHKSVPHTCTDLPPLLSTDVTGDTTMFLAAVYKYLQRL
jgi:hypothetical protein